ncbi:MAG: endonuclease/exonuclease/phosphatase family protein [Anaerolineae bacterium]
MPTTLTRSTLRRALFNLFCMGYPCGVGLLLVMRLVFSFIPLLTLITTFLPFLFFPLAFLLPLALLARSRLAALSNLVLLIVGLALYAPLYLPRPAAADNSAARLRVMTFNLGPGQAAPQEVTAAIANENADIVAVQELTPATAESFKQQLARYPSMILLPENGSVGFITRYPILRSEWFRPSGSGRPGLDLILDVAGTPVHFIAIHPDPPDIAWLGDTELPIGVDDSEQAREIANVAATAARLKGPVIVAGDFNSGDSSRGYQAMASVLRDSYREAGRGLGLTFPHGLMVDRIPIPGPFVRLDYIFHSASSAST